MYVDIRTTEKMRDFIRRVNILSSLIDETDDAFFHDIFLRLKWHDGEDEELEKAADKVNAMMAAVRDLAALGKDEYMKIIMELPQVQKFEVIRGGHIHE